MIRIKYGPNQQGIREIEICQVSKYPGYPIGGKIWHHARLLKNPIVGLPKSFDSMSAAQGMNDKLYLT
jgi:hypothetical protein